MIYSELLTVVHRRLARAWDVTMDEVAHARFGDSVPDWPAFPDSAEALAYLKQHYQLVILSNVDRESFKGSNRRLGVEFDAIYTAQDVGSYKPNLRNFDYMLAHLAERGVAKGRFCTPRRACSMIMRRRSGLAWHPHGSTGDMTRKAGARRWRRRKVQGTTSNFHRWWRWSRHIRRSWSRGRTLPRVVRAPRPWSVLRGSRQEWARQRRRAPGDMHHARRRTLGGRGGSCCRWFVV